MFCIHSAHPTCCTLLAATVYIVKLRNSRYLMGTLVSDTCKGAKNPSDMYTTCTDIKAYKCKLGAAACMQLTTADRILSQLFSRAHCSHNMSYSRAGAADGLLLPKSRLPKLQVPNPNATPD